MKLPQAVSESVKRLNPTLFGPGPRLPDSKREQDKGREGEHQKLEESPSSVGYCITIISCRKRLVDEHDNLRSGAKPLVDSITASLGFTQDNDPHLTWEYGQVISKHPKTIVRIERHDIS